MTYLIGPKLKPEAFTLEFVGMTNIIVTQVGISQAFDINKSPHPLSPLKIYFGIWDTGATATMITKKVAQECGLVPIGVENIETANGTMRSNVYLISLKLPHTSSGISSLRVTEGILNGDANVLIGMDVIAGGDFAISSWEGKSYFSFRFPSTRKIDFVAEVNKATLRQKRNNRNKSKKKRR